MFARRLQLTTIKALEKSPITRFEDVLRSHVKAVQAENPQPPVDLSPPEFLQDALSDLKVLMASYETSLVPVTEREEDFKPILNAALDPYLEMCDRMGGELKAPGKHIFALNSFLAAKVCSSFSRFPDFPFDEMVVGVGRLIEV